VSVPAAAHHITSDVQQHLFIHTPACSS